MNLSDLYQQVLRIAEETRGEGLLKTSESFFRIARILEQQLQADSSAATEVLSQVQIAEALTA